MGTDLLARCAWPAQQVQQLRLWPQPVLITISFHQASSPPALISTGSSHFCPHLCTKQKQRLPEWQPGASRGNITAAVAAPIGAG